MSDNQIDEYRQPWESDEHWTLRKEFIEHYKNDFPEDRLLCLAQAYSNVELLGCSYPTLVMRQINELAKDLRVCDILRQSRKDRARIEFVKEEKNNSKNSDHRSKRSFPEVSETIHKFSKLSPGVLTCNKRKAIDIVTCDKNKEYNTLSSTKTDLFVKNCGEQDPLLKILPNAVAKIAISGSTFDLSPGPISDGSLCRVDVSIPNKTVSNLQSDIQDQNTTMAIPEFMRATSKDIYKFLQKLLFKQITPTVVLENLRKEFNFKVEFKIHLLPKREKRCPMFQCEVEINDALLSSAQGSSKKKACSEAAKQAVVKLMHALPSAPSNFQVPNHPKMSNSVNRFPDPTIKKQNYPVGHEMKTRKKIRASDSPQMLVLLDYTDIRKIEGPVAILVDSANFNRVPLKFEFEYLPWVPENVPMIKTSVILNGHSICSATGITKQIAKHKASEIALANLRKISYTIKVKDEHNDGFIVSRNQVFDVIGSGNSLSENNVGCKMLKMMGWSGGGIGKSGNKGIEEPVKPVDSHKRGQGLGFNSKGFREMTSRLEQIIHDYARSNSTSDLIFAADFSIEERKEIHRIANKYSLKNNSKGGKGNSRHVVVSRRFTPKELLEHLLSEGGSTHKYELVDKTG